MDSAPGWPPAAVLVTGAAALGADTVPPGSTMRPLGCAFVRSDFCAPRLSCIAGVGGLGAAVSSVLSAEVRW